MTLGVSLHVISSSMRRRTSGQAASQLRLPRPHRVDVGSFPATYTVVKPFDSLGTLTHASVSDLANDSEIPGVRAVDRVAWYWALHPKSAPSTTILLGLSQGLYVTSYIRRQCGQYFLGPSDSRQTSVATCKVLSDRENGTTIMTDEVPVSYRTPLSRLTAENSR
ncbi:hypothetical protein NEOLEDRAFT_307884 [Neolentinus lepideus HHB14362 ss-1]|uniref:Uncharacterized protein n=1 Tax=Neolentinus lepideus HHB14362 ss-1 TaxID=1314782 RepID=A0A165VRW0_9AGAM|nr:hypothetical protein NEOLEDRAFT_307884 [Neolentinus lepideus HHB14362 ss-1]